MSELLTVNMTGTPNELWQYFVSLAPEIPDVYNQIRAEQNHRYVKRETRIYEAALLYCLAKQYNHPGAQFLEIGMCYGWTAAVMAHAAPDAHIVTMSPNPAHYHYGRDNLTIHPNVEALKEYSEILLSHYDGPELDLVFVDGDHKGALHDVPWFNWLKVGGVMFWHDYCPAGCPIRPCRWVYDAVNMLRDATHEFDVFIADDNAEGMAGIYRRKGETWPITQP